MIIRKILNKINNLVYPPHRYSNKSFSQEGEDLIVRSIFASKQDVGFYVDIGAHHPYRLSNTFCFYEMGWSGINIDPIPNMKLLFDSHRHRDINLNLGVSNNSGEMKYFIFNEPAVNTFNEQLAFELANESKHRCKLVETKVVKVDTLANILNNHIINDKFIDFMSIDVKGYELEVLQSNDWSRYRPKVLLVEIHNLDFENLHSNEVYKYLNDIGYKMIAKTLITSFWQENRKG